MILMVTDPAESTGRQGQPPGTPYVDGITYLTGTPDEIARRRASLAEYRARLRAHMTGPSGPGRDPGDLTFTEVTEVPEHWTALASDDAHLTAYATLRRLGITPAITTGSPA